MRGDGPDTQHARMNKNKTLKVVRVSVKVSVGVAVVVRLSVVVRVSVAVVEVHLVTL